MTPEHRSFVVRGWGESLLRLRSAFVVIFSLAMAVCNPGTARAQTSEAVAEALFRDGKLYFQAEDYDRACPKLAQSYDIDPAGGTVLLLAICYEKQGKLASAWARYNDALALAKRDAREDRERRAREGLESVEPGLSYIRLAFDPTLHTIAGLTLTIDGTNLPAVSDTRLPIDPGIHRLVIRAPEYDEWATEVNINTPAEIREISVPLLQRKPVQQQKVTSTPEPASTPLLRTDANSGSEHRTRDSHAWARRSAYVLGGTGLATVAIGSYFGIRAIKLNNQANEICPSSQCREDQLDALAKLDDARSNARLSTILIGAGSAAVISAALLWYVYRKDVPAVTAGADVATRSVSISWQQPF